MRIAVNDCWGGFSVSHAIYDILGIKWDGYGFLSNKDLGIESNNCDAYRADARLIAAIEKIGCDAASGEYAEITIIEVPDDIEWYIDNYDGKESVHEEHRSWY